MSSASRPFQSWTVSRLLAESRRRGQGMSRWWRRSRMGLVWGLQVAIYPAYVVFQGVRKGHRYLQVLRPWEKLGRLLRGEPIQPARLLPDAPIRALLAKIQPRGVNFRQRYPAMQADGMLLAKSSVSYVLAAGQWYLLPINGPVVGVASELSSGQIILVLGENQRFDGLTIDQQDRLRQAIVLLLAEYGRTCRRRVLDDRLRRPGLPLPVVNSAQWLPIQWGYQGMRWMQTSSLAITTNLFGEALVMQRVSAQRQAVSMPARYLNSQDRAASIDFAIPAAREPFPTKIKQARREPTDLSLADDRVRLLPGDQFKTGADTLLIRDGAAEQRDYKETGSARHSQSQRSPRADVVDAQATFVKYVEPPARVLLRWLDQGIFWLETWLKKLWNWLKAHW